MMDAREIKEQKAKDRAKNLRYKKPLVSGLNYDEIISQLYDMDELAGQIDVYDRDAIEEAIGDEEDASEFITQFQMLDGSIQRTIEELTDWQSMCQEDYDLCLVAACAGSEGGYMGYDAYEEDYFRLDSFEADIACSESKEKVMRKTKSEIVDMFQRSIRILTLFYNVKYRFDCLQTAMETIKGKTEISKEMLDELDRLYVECDKEKWYNWKECVNKFNKLAESLPPDAWLK